MASQRHLSLWKGHNIEEDSREAFQYISENTEVKTYGIRGLNILEDFITSETETDLLNYIYKQPWDRSLKRLTQHYGYRYDYRSRSAEKTVSMPEIFNVFDDPLFNQAIVNRYEPGEGISPHIDSPIFGEIIASLSLLSDIVMTIGEKDVLLKRRSLLILSSDARHKIKHSIAPRKFDMINGEKLQRKTRISITYRTYEN